MPDASAYDVLYRLVENRVEFDATAEKITNLEVRSLELDRAFDHLAARLGDCLDDEAVAVSYRHAIYRVGLVNGAIQVERLGDPFRLRLPAEADLGPEPAEHDVILLDLEVS